MQPITRAYLDRQDLPILFLAWLLPATFLLLTPAYPVWLGAWFSAQNRFVMDGAWAFSSQVWPLTLLLAFIAATACCAVYLIGKRGMLIALSFCSGSVIVLAQFAPGQVSGGAFQIVLLMGLLAFSLGAGRVAKLGIGAGLCASALLAIGPQTVPFAALAVVWFAIDWAADRGERGGLIDQKTQYFGYSIASGTIVLGIPSLTEWANGSVSCGPLALTQIAPAVLAGLGLAHLSRVTTEISTLRKRLGCIGLVALIALTGSLAINATCLVTAGSKAETLWAHKFGLLSLLANDPRTAYVLLATPIIGLGAACFALLREQFRGPERLGWGLMLGCLFTAIVVLILDVRLAIYANALAIIPCAYFTQVIGAITRTSRPTPFAGALFIIVWLSGMNITHSLLATYALTDSSVVRTQSAVPASLLRS